MFFSYSKSVNITFGHNFLEKRISYEFNTKIATQTCQLLHNVNHNVNYGLFTAAAGPLQHACSDRRLLLLLMVDGEPRFPAGPAAKAQNNCSVRRRSETQAPPLLPLWCGTMWLGPASPPHPITRAETCEIDTNAEICENPRKIIIDPKNVKLIFLDS